CRPRDDAAPVAAPPNLTRIARQLHHALGHSVIIITPHPAAARRPLPPALRLSRWRSPGGEPPPPMAPGFASPPRRAREPRRHRRGGLAPRRPPARQPQSGGEGTTGSRGVRRYDDDAVAECVVELASDSCEIRWGRDGRGVIAWPA